MARGSADHSRGRCLEQENRDFEPSGGAHPGGREVSGRIIESPICSTKAGVGTRNRLDHAERVHLSDGPRVHPARPASRWKPASEIETEPHIYAAGGADVNAAGAVAGYFPAGKTVTWIRPVTPELSLRMSVAPAA